MTKYFEVKATFMRVDDVSGKEKKVTEAYLIDAVSFTDGEARIITELEKIVSGDFKVTNMATSNISRVFPSENNDRFFKAKVTFVGIDEESGKEKKTTEYMLVEANDVEDAYVLLQDKLSDMIVPFEIPSVSESKIAEVFEYDLEVANELFSGTLEQLDGMTITALSSERPQWGLNQVNDQPEIHVDFAKGKDVTAFSNNTVDCMDQYHEHKKAELESEK